MEKSKVYDVIETAIQSKDHSVTIFITKDKEITINIFPYSNDEEKAEQNVPVLSKDRIKEEFKIRMTNLAMAHNLALLEPVTFPAFFEDLDFKYALFNCRNDEFRIYGIKCSEIKSIWDLDKAVEGITTHVKAAMG